MNMKFTFIIQIVWAGKKNIKPREEKKQTEILKIIEKPSWILVRWSKNQMHSLKE